MKNKHLLALLFLSLSFSTWAQDAQAKNEIVPLDNTGRIQYLEVVEQEDSSTELFKLCVKWINTAYTNPTAVTKERNMTDKKIVIKHLFPIYDGAAEQKNHSGRVLYTLTLQFKNNRYRIKLTDFLLKQPSRFPARKWLEENSADYHPEYIQQLNTFSTKLIDSLKKGMLPKTEYQEEEW